MSTKQQATAKADAKHEAAFVQVDAETAFVVGEGDDRVYFEVGRDASGAWRFSAIADAGSVGAVSSLHRDHGPYDTRLDAFLAGLKAATTWCGLQGQDVPRHLLSACAFAEL